MEEDSIINYIFNFKKFHKMVTKGDRRKNYRLFLYKVLDEEKKYYFF